MTFLPRIDRKGPSERDKIKACKETMVILNRFIMNGAALSPFEIAMLLGREPEPQVVHTHRFGRFATDVIPFARDWIAKNVPPTAFLTEGDVRSWMDHDGLRGASYEKRLWFRMFSDWWAPVVVATS